MNPKACFYKIVILLLFVSFSSLSMAELGIPVPNEDKSIAGNDALPLSAVEDNSELLKSFSSLKSGMADYGTAPYWNWIEQFGGTAQDFLEDITHDSEGNVYVTGHFSGALRVGDKNLISKGFRDAITAKFDRNGELIWITQVFTEENQETGSYKIVVGPDQSTYITGYYIGAINVAGKIMPDNHWYNLFVAKISPQGQIIMFEGHPTTNNVEVGLDIDLDDSGNIYVLGALNTNVENFRAPSVLIKYGPSGDIVWEQQHDERFSSLEVADTSLYLAGTLTSINGGTMDGILDTNVSVRPPWGYNDAFLAKADLSGVFNWATRAEHADSMSGDSYSTHLEVDNSENIYMAGSYRSEVTFGLTSLTPSGFNENFIAACAPDGQFQWALTFDDRIEGIALDETERPLVAKTQYLYRISPDSMLVSILDTLSFTPTAISRYYNMVAPEESSLDIVGTKTGTINLEKRDVDYDLLWLTELTGNSGAGHILGMVSDNSGNIYTLGKATGPLSFFGNELPAGLFVAKQDVAGNVLWLKEIPGLDFSTSLSRMIVLDPAQQNIYFASGFDKEIDIGGDVQLIPSSESNMFIAKYGTDGTYQYVYQGDFDATNLFLAPDYSGNLYCSGIFSDTIVDGIVSLSSAGGNDVYIIKLDAGGTPLWAKRAGGESQEYSGPVSVDNLDNLYLAGEFWSVDVTIDATPITLNDGDGNIILSKLDPSGNVLWVDSKSGSNLSFGDNNCWPTSIETDASGNSYVKGWHGDSVYFDTILLTSPHGTYSYFIAKFDTDGNTLWANSIQERSYGFDYNQMDIDSEGSVYFGAQARDTLWFGTDYVYEHVGGIDLFVAKYNSDGSLGWVKTIEGSGGNSYIKSVAVSDTNRIFVAADMNDYLGFDDIELSSTTSHGVISMLTGSSLPGISYTKKDVSAAGSNDGSISITVRGGTPPFSYLWSNGAKTKDIGTLVAGEYTLIVTDAIANTTSRTISIEEPADTACNITAEFEFFTEGLQTDYLNLSKGLANSYSWTFGDGNYSSLTSPTHVFADTGVYKTCLAVYDSLTGCLQEICQIVKAGDAYLADFEYYHNADTLMMVNFTSLVSGPSDSYYWTFGDGQTSTVPNPSHIYEESGYYEVSLTVTDTEGNSMVHALGSVQVGSLVCKADFSYYIDVESNTVYFKSLDPDQDLVYNWIFGDGSQSEEKDPKHTFTDPGFYKVNLSIYDAVTGCLDSKEETIQVGRGMDIKADFIYQTQPVGTSIRLQDASIGEGLSYYWNFGDGGSSTKANPIYEYGSSGYYNICLNIYSSNGLQDLICKPVFIGTNDSENCQARFNYLVDEATRTTVFTDRSFGDPNSWTWKFGDGQTSNVRYPKHTYASDDYYTVHLKIQNSMNCLDHAFKLVNVGMEGGLVAGFGYIIHTPTKKAETYPIDFIGISLGDAGKLKWNFGDGNIDTTTMTPTHDFEKGIYNVCFSISDPNTMASDSICKMLQIGPVDVIKLMDEEDLGLSIIPNPVNDHGIIEFTLKAPESVDLALYDLRGRKIRQFIRGNRAEGMHQLDLHGSDYEDGHYCLIIKTKSKVQRTLITIRK